MSEDCFLDNDGGSEVQAVAAADSAGRRQSLHVRVGPVFHGSVPSPEPGIWIDFQPEHLNSLPLGSVLLTPAVWRKLNEAVEERLRWRESTDACKSCKIPFIKFVLRFCRECGRQP